MSQQTTRPKSVEDLDTVVDADAHMAEGVADVLPYIDDRHDGIKRVIAETDDPMRDIYSATHPLEPFLETDPQHIERHDEMGEVPAKLAEMDEFGIDYAVVNAGLTGLCLPSVNNTRAAVALANGYNNWMLDNVVDADDRFKALMLVAHQKPDAAAEEIDRVAGEDDVVGVLVPSTGAVPPLGHFRYDPVYEAAQDNGLPVVLHGASTNTSQVFPLARMFNETYSEDHTMIHPFSQMWELISMMFQGVPARYPDLEFVVQESGVAWVPFLTWRMDDHYLELSHESPHLEKLPSEYVHDQFYFSTQPLGHTARDPAHLANVIEAAGPHNILYSSDLPHTDFDPPEELFDRIAPHFEAEEVRAMMGETAAGIFGLD